MYELDIRLDQLRKLIYADLDHPKLKVLTQQIIKNKQTNLEKAQAIYNFIKTNVRYVREPEGLDIYQRPSVTVSLGRGDCDKAASLAVALGKIAGVPVKLRVVAQRPDLWSHIYPMFLANHHWVPLDPAAPVSPGQEVKYLKARDYYV